MNLLIAPRTIQQSIWLEVLYNCPTTYPRNRRDYEFDINRKPNCCAFCGR